MGRALSHSEKAGESVGIAATYANIAGIYVRRKQWEEAIKYYRRALEAQKEREDIHLVSQITINLGIAYMEARESQACIQPLIRPLLTL